jgi:aldehyde:ferredoxin oxidoreductase
VEVLQEAFNLCQKYGMDGVTTGCVIAYLMELVEKGLVKKQNVGVDLEWGNHEAMLQLVKIIGERKGIGILLGEGVKRIAQHIGGLAVEYAVHVKGLELPSHDPRASNAYALHFATCNSGGAHFTE